MRREAMRFASVSAKERNSAFRSGNRPFRPPFACGEGGLSLPKLVEGAILASLIRAIGDPFITEAAMEEGGRDTFARAAGSTDDPAFAFARPLPSALLCHRCAAA